MAKASIREVHQMGIMILNHTIPLNPISKCQQTGNQNNQWLDCIPPGPPDLLLFYICDHLALVLGDDVGSSTDDSQLFLWYLQNISQLRTLMFSPTIRTTFAFDIFDSKLLACNRIPLVFSACAIG